jgi:hypothetical protein
MSLSSGTISSGGGNPTNGNNDLPMVFRATDGASATADSPSLVLHVGTSFNSITAVQNHSVTCASPGNLGTVTSGNLILILYNSIKADVQFTDTLGTVYASLPVSFHMLGGGVGSIINWVAWGFAPSTGTATLNCTGSPILIAATELSNVQKTFDPAAQVITLASSASPYTSGSMTAPGVRNALLLGVSLHLDRQHYHAISVHRRFHRSGQFVADHGRVSGWRGVRQSDRFLCSQRQYRRTLGDSAFWATGHDERHCTRGAVKESEKGSLLKKKGEGIGGKTDGQ